MADHPLPEMMRLSLSDLALRIKIMKVKLGTSIEDVLSRALDPPAPLNVQRAVSVLVEVSFVHFVRISITYKARFVSGSSFHPSRRNHTYGSLAQQTAY